MDKILWDPQCQVSIGNGHWMSSKQVNSTLSVLKCTTSPLSLHAQMHI